MTIKYCELVHPPLVTLVCSIVYTKSNALVEHCQVDTHNNSFSLTSSSYNISDFSRLADLSVIINGNDSVGYSPITDADVYDDVGIIPCDAGWEYDRSQFTRTFLQEVSDVQGWIQDFDLGGGGGEVAQNMRAHTHHEREALSPLRPGSRVRLRALEALRDL